LPAVLEQTELSQVLLRVLCAAGEGCAVGDGGAAVLTCLLFLNKQSLVMYCYACCVLQAKDALWVMEGRLSGTLLGVAAIPSLPLS
jgi:hypothetical protein